MSLKSLARVILAVFLVAAGTLHFFKTATYVRIVPPWLPGPAVLVYISGVCEILGGVGAIVPVLRRVAGVGLIALLVAVFPANVQMAMHPSTYADIASPLALWLRLPIQLVLVGWVWYACLLNPRPGPPAL
jgi:uncharacterized membrane protein